MEYDLNAFDTDVLLELYYELQKEKDREAILSKKLWHESLEEKDVIFKGQSVNTDPEELQIRLLLKEVLRESEKNTLKNLYKADKKKLKLLHLTFKDVKIEDRKKEVFNGTYTYQKSTLPVFVKEINSISVDLIAVFDKVKANKELLLAILGAGQAGIDKAYRDAGLKNPWVLSTSKFADFYKARAEKFTDAVSDNVQSRIRTVITEGLKDGLGTDQIADKIKEAYKKPIEVIVNEGKKNESVRYLDNEVWANMVARTETSWASNQGRLDAYGESGLVKDVEWITAPDPCPDCEANRGQVFTLEEAQNLIPLHTNCRCSYVVSSYQERNIEGNIKPDFTKYGTSAGVTAAWDTRGRGRKEQPKKERVRNTQLSHSMEDKETINQIMNDTGVSKLEAERMYSAVSGFTSENYATLRKMQMRNQETRDGKLVEQYIEKAPKFTNDIYRGIDSEDLLDKLATGKIKKGDVIDMKGTSSWSSKQVIANDFIRDTDGPILITTNNCSLSTAIAHLSSNPQEFEVIVSKLAKFKINNIKKVGSKVVVDVSETQRKVNKSYELSKETTIDSRESRLESDRHIMITRNDEIIYEYNVEMKKYGTSEGAIAGWDVRGRGRKTEEKKPERIRNEQLQQKPWSEQVKQVEEDAGLTREDATATVQAIHNYTEVGYMPIRSYQSGDLSEGMGEKYISLVKERERLIELYIDKSPKFTDEIYRGIQSPQLEEEVSSGRIKIGDVIDMRGTSSWSSDETSSNKFGNIVFKTKDNQLATAINHLSSMGSAFSQESEVIVSKLAKFKIIKIEKFPGKSTFNKPFASKDLIIIHTESINPISKSFEIEKANRTNSEIKSRQESDKYITITRDGKVIYQYNGEENKSNKNNKIIDMMFKYGTSEGVTAAWDTRGRGRKEQSKKEEIKISIRDKKTSELKEPSDMGYDNVEGDIKDTLEPLFREGYIKDSGEFKSLSKEQKIKESNKLAKLFDTYENDETYEVVRRDSIATNYANSINKEPSSISYDDIPEEVSIYRGSSDREDFSKDKIRNFTLDRQVAEKFGSGGVVTEYKVNKGKIDYIFNQGLMNESETFIRLPKLNVTKVKELSIDQRIKSIDVLKEKGVWNKIGEKIKIGNEVGTIKSWGVGGSAIVVFDGYTNHAVMPEEIVNEKYNG